jgi:hypothetical protein
MMADWSAKDQGEIIAEAMGLNWCPERWRHYYLKNHQTLKIKHVTHVGIDPFTGDHKVRTTNNVNFLIKAESIAYVKWEGDFSHFDEPIRFDDSEEEQ